MDGSVILFDGYCNLCNGAVDFVITRDRQGYFKYASLQSDEGRKVLAPFGAVEESEAAQTFFLVEDGQLYRRSTAALRVARKLSGAWPLLYGFVIVPAPIRDFFYRVISKNRYKWFGKRDTCRLPTPEESSRFL